MPEGQQQMATQTLRQFRAAALEQSEKSYLEYWLNHHRGHISKTAATAGIDRKTFYRKIRQYGIDPKTVDWTRFLGNAPRQSFDEYRFRNWRWFWDFGGGIFTEDGAVALTNSTVSGNTSAEEGGGIHNYGGTFTLTNSTVSGNSTSLKGGGIFASYTDGVGETIDTSEQLAAGVLVVANLFCHW